MTPDEPTPSFLARTLGVLGYTRRAVDLVTRTSRGLTLALFGFTLLAGLVPAAIAWVGKGLVDAVVAASEAAGEPTLVRVALLWVAAEAALVLLLAGFQRALSVTDALLRARLGHRVNVLILEKALQLDLVHFEDATLYDRMTQARREASSRPLALVRKSFGLLQNAISLTTYGALLLGFSPLAVLALALAALPSFLAETRFAGEAFRLFKWRTPEKRKQAYLEVVVAREDYAKEVKLLQIGRRLVDEYDAIFRKLYAEDRGLTQRRGLWGFLLGGLSTVVLYGAYATIAWSAATAVITLGEMTMYLLVFKQGQSAFAAILQAIGGMYEDNLYVANLYAFLDEPVRTAGGTATEGPDPTDGLRLHDVSFTYPDAPQPSLRNVSLHVRPGRKLALVGHNGSGKTTLIKLVTRLYEPTSGHITLDGLDLREWDPDALRQRLGVIFQDFVKYQFTVGENIGVGDVAAMDDPSRQQDAATLGMAWPFIADMPDQLATQLGRWFPDGRELSIGQWQKVALSRAFMRKDASLLVLDEPTSAMDATAEAEIFDRVRAMTGEQMAILISHRFSTVRMADDIVVLAAGQVIERGDHGSLMEAGGTYAELFALQAAGYQ
jgi:ABC-type multidrug transport system fused ATPase/permease subunit